MMELLIQFFDDTVELLFSNPAFIYYIYFTIAGWAFLALDFVVYVAISIVRREAPVWSWHKPLMKLLSAFHTLATVILAASYILGGYLY